MDFYRDTWLEIDLDAIHHNISSIKKYYAKGRKLFAVVKADGYGHGAVMVAKTAIKAGASYLAVATLDEAIELRKNKIHVPILLLGNMRVKDLKIAAKYRVMVTAHNLTWLKEAINTYRGKKVNVHIKVDTGMHRIGLLTIEELKDAVHLINKSNHFKLTGVFTHMATSEEEDERYFRIQQQKFHDFLDVIDTKGLLIHLANSAATIKYDDPYTNACRCGIMIYGLSPNSKMELKFELKQAIRLYAKLTHVKLLKKGSKISYNGIYETEEDEWIGSLAIGYADGWDRRLKQAYGFINEEYCPIVGRICMDQTLIKLPYEMKEGTIVELIGPHIHVDELAQDLNTINYQVVCLLSDRLPRAYNKKGRTIKVSNRRIQKLKL